MKKRVQKYLAPALWWLFGMTAAAALGWSLLEMTGILRSGPATSFPWWTPFAFAGLYIGPLLLLELAAALFFTLWLRRKAGKTGKEPEARAVSKANL